MEYYRFFERDISWLSFNERVLQEAGDRTVPLLERLKFLAIYSSNLDEFYRVRIAHHKYLLKLNKRLKSEFHLNPKRVIELVNQTVYKQQEEFGRIFKAEIIPRLRRQKIFLSSVENLNKSQRAYLSKYFKKKVFKFMNLEPIMQGAAPFLENRVVYFVISSVVKDILRKYYLLRIPHAEVGRFIKVPSKEGMVIVQLDDLVRYFIPQLIKKGNVSSINAIKISRDADLYLEDEFGDTIMEKIKRSLEKRSKGVPTRFLYDEEMPSSTLNRLIDCYNLKKQDIIPGDRYHSFHDFFAFPKPDIPKLFYKPMRVLKHRDFHRQKDYFKVLSKKDVLIAFPYQDYHYVINFLEKAVNDNNVKSISITLYRVARDSRICMALEKAALKGIRVTVFDEVQARFDEESNLYWGNRLTLAGATVIYSIRRLKVHTKLLLIETEEKEKQVFYSYLSTGNFNEKTADIYCDLGLFTKNQEMGSEVNKIFRFLENQKARYKYKHLLVAPFSLRDKIEDLIDFEIEQAQKGKKAEIFLKLNSLEDKVMIRKLYDASEAGVRIKIIVRGICCLVPGVKGMSDKIRAISIVDRYLEHARIFVFHNAGEPKYFMSSADFMKRNLSRRVEVAFPVLEKEPQEILKNMLDIQWSDNVKARRIDVQQTNKYKKSKSNKKIQSQYEFYSYLKTFETKESKPAKKSIKTPKSVKKVEKTINKVTKTVKKQSKLPKRKSVNITVKKKKAKTAK